MGNMSGLIEGIVLVSLFVIILTGILAGLNSEYGLNYDVGLDTSPLEDIGEGMQVAYDETSGEVEQTNEGLTLLSSWRMVKGLLNILWDVVSGNWFSTIVINMLQITGESGAMIAIALRVLFASALIFTLIALFFKMRA